MNAQDDSGFSLIELIITIGLLGLASSAILGAMFMGMQTVDDTSTRFVNANNRNFSTKYVIPDVQAWDAAKSAATSNLVAGRNVMTCPSGGDEFHVVSEVPPVHAAAPAGKAGRRVTRTYRVDRIDGECVLVREGSTETLLFCASGVPGEDAGTCSVAPEPSPLPAPATERVEVLSGLRAEQPVCVDFIEAGVDYSPSADADWCVSKPAVVYERPTLRIWIADDEDTPVGQFDYTVTASSRVGRVSS